MTVRFNTGPVAHTLVAGIELGRETSTPTRIRYTGVPTANLLTPNLSQPFAGIPSIQTQINTRSSSYSAYLVDTIEIGEHWELIGGFRWDTFETSFKQYIAPAVSSQPHRQHAELARRHRLQAVAERQRVFRLRHVVQSVGRDALACRQHRRPRAGGERDLRGRHQVGWSTMAA